MNHTALQFATSEELRALTGYKQRSRQRRWLREHGYAHDVDRHGAPVVLRAVVAAALGAPEPKGRREPDVVALREYQRRRR